MQLLGFKKAQLFFDGHVPYFWGPVQPVIQILQIAFDIFEFLSNFHILQRKQIMIQDSKYFVHKACEHF